MIKAKAISFFVIVMLCIGFTDSDERTKKAREVLDKMRNNIDSCTSAKVNFQLRLSNAEKKVIEIHSMVFYSKGTKYRLEHKDLISIFDGEYEYTNVHPGKEQDELIRIEKSFFKKEGSLYNEIHRLDGFKYVYLEKENKKQSSGHFVSLFPLQPDKKKYHTVKLEVNRETYLPASMQLLMDDGTALHLTITSLKTNIALEDSLFTIHKK